MVTVAKMSVGDFNGDSYANEIAVITNVPDQWKYYLYVYQVSWKNIAMADFNLFSYPTKIDIRKTLRALMI